MQRNVLFLMIDCMRADILWDRQRYPYVPNIDALMARSTSFTEMITAATTTTPSVATLLTGRYPAEHGVRSLARLQAPARGQDAARDPARARLPHRRRGHRAALPDHRAGSRLRPVPPSRAALVPRHGWGSKIVATLAGNRAPRAVVHVPAPLGAALAAQGEGPVRQPEVRQAVVSALGGVPGQPASAHPRARSTRRTPSS